MKRSRKINKTTRPRPQTAKRVATSTKQKSVKGTEPSGSQTMDVDDSAAIAADGGSSEADDILMEMNDPDADMDDGGDEDNDFKRENRDFDGSLMAEEPDFDEDFAPDEDDDTTSMAIVPKGKDSKAASTKKTIKTEPEEETAESKQKKQSTEVKPNTNGVKTLEPSHGLPVSPLDRMPVELWTELFAYLHPMEIARLRGVCRQFYGMLINENVWRRSRKIHTSEVPKPVFGMKEWEMWRLFKGASCMLCDRYDNLKHASNMTKVYWPFRVRCCHECFDENTSKESTLYNDNKLPISSEDMKILLPAIPFGILTAQNNWILGHSHFNANAGMLRIYWNDDILEIKERYDEAKQMNVADEWIKGLENEAQIHRSDANRIDIWESRGYQVNASHGNVQRKIATHVSSSHTGSQQQQQQQQHFSHPNLLPVGSFNAQQQQLHHQQQFTKTNFFSNTRHERTASEVAEIKAQRQRDIETRAQQLDPPMTPEILAHAPAFQAAIKIAQPFNDLAWSNLLPRLLEQRGGAEKAAKQQLEQDAKVQQQAEEQRHLEAKEKDQWVKKERAWEESQGPVREMLSAIADVEIKNWGGNITKETAPRFAATMLIKARKDYYEQGGVTGKGNEDTEESASDVRKLVLENMKYVFDNKIKPLTDPHRKELFLCKGCGDTNPKLYGFEGVIQHYAAKHTTELSLGSVVVHWRSEWPQAAPFYEDALAVKRMPPIMTSRPPLNQWNPKQQQQQQLQQQQQQQQLQQLPYQGRMLPQQPMTGYPNGPLQPGFPPPPPVPPQRVGYPNQASQQPPLPPPQHYQMPGMNQMRNQQQQQQHQGPPLPSRHQPPPTQPSPGSYYSIPPPMPSYQQHPGMPGPPIPHYPQPPMQPPPMAPSPVHHSPQGYGQPPYQTAYDRNTAFFPPTPSQQPIHYDYQQPPPPVYPTQPPPQSYQQQHQQQQQPQQQLPLPPPPPHHQQHQPPQRLPEPVKPATPPVPASVPKEEDPLRQEKLKYIAALSVDQWNKLSNIKDLPYGIKVFVMAKEVCDAFRQKFNNTVPSIQIFHEALREQISMKFLRNVSGLCCKTCAPTSERTFTLPLLLQHFESIHMYNNRPNNNNNGAGVHTAAVDDDWLFKMIKLPEMTELKQQLPRFDKERLRVLEGVYPGIFDITKEPEALPVVIKAAEIKRETKPVEKRTSKASMTAAEVFLRDFMVGDSAKVTNGSGSGSKGINSSEMDVDSSTTTDKPEGLTDRSKTTSRQTSIDSGDRTEIRLEDKRRPLHIETKKRSATWSSKPGETLRERTNPGPLTAREARPSSIDESGRRRGYQSPRERGREPARDDIDRDYSRKSTPMRSATAMDIDERSPRRFRSPSPSFDRRDIYERDYPREYPRELERNERQYRPYDRDLNDRLYLRREAPPPPPPDRYYNDREPPRTNRYSQPEFSARSPLSPRDPLYARTATFPGVVIIGVSALDAKDHHGGMKMIYIEEILTMKGLITADGMMITTMGEEGE